MEKTKLFALENYAGNFRVHVTPEIPKRVNHSSLNFIVMRLTHGWKVVSFCLGHRSSRSYSTSSAEAIKKYFAKWASVEVRPFVEKYS